MPNCVCNGANMQCSFGTGPGSLTVLPDRKIMEENQPAANMMDFKPMVNILTCSMKIEISQTLNNNGSENRDFLAELKNYLHLCTRKII